VTSEERAPFEGWAILELMGHRRLAGYVREQELAGSGFIRLDVPGAEGEDDVATQFYAPGAVYCLTPTTETIARRVALLAKPTPVTQFELPAGPPAEARDDDQEEPLF
jgi:hypothetical protein